MPRMNWGDRMPSSYLETFKIDDGKQARIAILGMENLAAMQCHWVSTQAGTKGFFECIGGICCQVGGKVSQFYGLPIWEYTVPRQGPMTSEGVVKVLRMSKAAYDSLVTISSLTDLNTVDLVVQGTKSGFGVKLDFFADTRNPSLLLPDWRASIVAGLGDVIAVVENTIMRRATPNDWMKLAQEIQMTPAVPQQPAFGAQQPAGFVQQANPAAMFGQPQIAQAPQQHGFGALPQAQQPQAPQFGQPQHQHGFAAPQATQVAGSFGQQAQQPVAPAAVRQAPPTVLGTQPQPPQFGAPVQQPPAFLQPQAPAQQPAFQAPSPPPFGQPQFGQPQVAQAQAVAEQEMSEEEMNALLNQKL